MADEIAHLGLVDEAEIELDKAALEIAALDHPGTDVSGCLELLDEMAERLRARAAFARNPAQQGARLAQVLGLEYGFEGDRETYDDPANADLISVLERRRGLPVSLSILYVALARRVGWSAHALNTPSHVLVSIGSPPTLVVDPFNRGAALRPGQLEGLLRSALGGLGAAVPAQVAPLTNRGVLVRLLMNQATRAEQAGLAERALTVWRRITTIAPAHSFAWWERARLERACGDIAGARKSLSSMLETTRDPDLRAQVTSALESLAG